MPTVKEHRYAMEVFANLGCRYFENTQFDPSDFWGPESYEYEYRMFIYWQPINMDPEIHGYGKSAIQNLLDKLTLLDQKGLWNCTRHSLPDAIEYMRKRGICKFVKDR